MHTARFEPGTPLLLTAIGAAASLTCLDEFGVDKIQQKNFALREYLLKGLEKLDAEIYGTLARIFHQFRREIADSQTGLALERPLSEATSRQVVATKRSRKRQERSAQTSEAAIATEI